MLDHIESGYAVRRTQAPKASAMMIGEVIMPRNGRFEIARLRLTLRPRVCLSLARTRSSPALKLENVTVSLT
jgi:hypothetical protein